MSNQNNMQAFITLNLVDEDGTIEINPAYIITMQRKTSESETGEVMPCTRLFITTGHTMFVWETPEQIAQLQMDATETIMKTVMEMTARSLEAIEDDYGY